MELKCTNLKPVHNSVNKELIFSFELKIKGFNITPINFSGILLTSDDKKIGNLILNSETNISRSILVAGVSETYKNEAIIDFKMSCDVSDASFNHIEKLRDTLDKDDINFCVRLNIFTLETKLQVSSIYAIEPERQGFQKTNAKINKTLVYSYANGNYSNSQNDLYILSTNDREQLGRVQNNPMSNCYVKITFTDWIKIFIPYFNGHSVFVFELPVPPYKYIPQKLHTKFNKAVKTLSSMKKYLELGEWKSVVIEARVIYELFKKLEEFNSLLLNSGYSIQALECIKQTLNGLFGFISKVQHAYQFNSKDINDDIEINREDAIFIYTNCCSLLNLISEKSRRLSE